MTKDKVLEFLEFNKGRPVSGQLMAQKLSISRNAVWKAVRSLRQEGYSISSATNSGYMLLPDNDIISEQGIAAAMGEKSAGLVIKYLPSVDSTNNEAKRIAAGKAPGNMLVCAGEQTAGRGRLGREFYSPADTGIYFSVLINPPAQAPAGVGITTAAAVSVVKAIEKLTDKKPLIKWVNDVYLDGKKICGILSEAVTDVESGSISSIIVGIGVNISTSEFPQEIESTASSLFAQNVSKNELIAEIAKEVLDYCTDFDFSRVREYYKAHCFILGRKIKYTVRGSVKCAVAEDIGESGELIVRTESGEMQTLASGEISVRTD